MMKLGALHVPTEPGNVLRGVALSVAAGQFAGLVGRNGAGKTTLLRSVMGLLPWNRGTIEFEGRSLRGIPAHGRARLGIGYMPEDRRLVPQLTVEENVLLPAWATGSQELVRRLASIYHKIPEVAAQAEIGRAHV